MRDLIARRPTLAAGLLYLVLSLVMFAPGMAPGRVLSASDYLWTATPWESSRPPGVPGLGSNQEQADAATQFQPALQATRDALPDIPLWDPYILSGRSFLGDPQSAVFSPFSVPSYVLPFWDSLAFVAALKLFVAALGAFLLGRGLGMRFGGALMCGLVFGFSLWAVTWVSWPHMSVWALLPWICLLAELCVRRPGPLPFAGLATAVGLQFLGGHPASSLQMLGVVAVFWLVRAMVAQELRERLAQRLLTLLAAPLVGTALAAVALIPFLELLSHSSDATARADASDLLSQPSRYLLGVFLYDYWGSKASALQFGTGLEERAYYVGALPLMLGAAALLVRRSRARIAVALVGAGALAVATGLPPLYDVVVALPGLDATNNGRFAVVTVVCLAVLAGWGLDELTGAPPRGRLVLGVAAGLVALPIVIALADREFGRNALDTAIEVAWGFQDAPTRAAAVVKLASVLEWAVLGAAALALVWLRLRGRLGAAAFVALALALVGFDLFKAGVGYNPAIPESHAVQPATPAIRYLQDQRPERFAALEVEDALSLAYPIPPNVAMRYRVNDVRGYVIPTEERYFELWRQAIAPGDGDCYYLFCTQSAPAEPGAFQALGLLGVSHLLQHPGDAPLPGLAPVYDGPDARLYANPSALPRAFVVDAQQVVEDGDAALAAVTEPGFPARNVAVTERRIEGLPEGAAEPALGSAQIVDYDAEKVVVESSAARPALLVLTDSWFPGWKAEVDGEEVPVERVDYVIRGVPVPAGTSRVEFTYEPASWRTGWIVSLLALMTILGAALVGWRRRSREPRRAQAATGMFEA
jgi:Bacterial membrane protein YfhO